MDKYLVQDSDRGVYSNGCGVTKILNEGGKYRGVNSDHAERE
jgi:hypothetical protein